MNYEVIVVGAGINGLATADRLVRMGVDSVALLEQFTLGHPNGSSHGRSRITRSSYSDPKYVDLMQWVHQRGWPEWEEEAGPLLHHTPGCFFGPGAQRYLDSLQKVPQVMHQVEQLTPEEGRKRFPVFRFPDSDLVLVDHTCAVIAAQRTMEFLTNRLRKTSVRLYEECLVTGFRSTPQALLVNTAEDGPLRCERLIFTAGPWTAGVLPDLHMPLRVAHQDVGYFQLDSPMHPPDFPVWVYAGMEPNQSFYGLPEFERDGVKLARHRTGPQGDSPDRPVEAEIPPAALEDLRQFAAAQWQGEPRLCGYEACLYTNTVSEDFVLDHFPQDPRVVIGAGFSGHGFKFAPLTGKILAELALLGKTSIAEFERCRDDFRLTSARAWS